MQLEMLKSIIPSDFGDDSRVWIYQSNRRFTDAQQEEINEQLLQFYSQWNSHGTPVKGWASLVFGQFIVVLADEKASHVSGCSTDSMVRVIKSIERQYDTHLFDRLTLTFLVEGDAQMLPLSQVPYALEKGYLKSDSLLFNNTVQTKEELMKSWLIPMNESWLATRLQIK